MRTLGVTVISVALLAGSTIWVMGQDGNDPTTTAELLSGMVTEEVEPGVLRVVSDGVRDLSSPADGYPGFSVDITPDGGVWLSGVDGVLFRLGEEPTFENPLDWPRMSPYLDVAPDGSLWATGLTGAGATGIFSFDGEAWTERATGTYETLLTTALAVGPEGTVWVAAIDRNKGCPDIEDGDCPGHSLLRLEDDGSLTTIEDWADVYDGDVYYHEVAVSPDGDVWLIGTGGPPYAAALLRFDGEGWDAIPGPAGWTPNSLSPRQLGFDLDGALWVNASHHDEYEGDVGGLARFDDPGWTILGEADGVEPWGGQGGGWISTDLLTVAPDGSFWLNGRPTARGCGGVAHWDGTTWTSYLLDSCIHDLAIAADGSVWLRADGGEWRTDLVYPGSVVHTYVIRPEVGATTE